WEANPAVGEYWLTLGKCLLELCRFEDVLALVQEAIRHGLDTAEMQEIRLRAIGGQAMSNVTQEQING
ncbi:MAG: hypothetical protein OEV35_00805, partial [Gallionellaceae bacterium]|nr:hypothetical protein [Gallionellaceae bacterium]